MDCELNEGWARHETYGVVKHFFRERDGLVVSLCGNYRLIAVPGEGLTTQDGGYLSCPTCTRMRHAEKLHAAATLSVVVGSSGM